MKISYVNSVCVRNDAISNAIRDEIGFLKDTGERDLRLYAYECDHPELPFRRCRDVRDIALDKHFANSDLVVFHFGVYYPLFDLFPVVPKNCRKLVVFHNITPPSVLPPKDRPLIERSFAQLDNARWADRIICDSKTNQEVLLARGISVPSSVVPLATHSDLSAPSTKPSFIDGTVRIAFVGRFVRSKGPDELLGAIERVSMHLPTQRIEVDMIGNLAFSDADLVDEVQAQAKRLTGKSGERLVVRIHGSAPEEVKRRVLADADIFALPTYHEGFCVPILEAIASGNRVVAYANSNTPDVTGDCGTLVATGSVEQMTHALRQEVARVISTDWRGTGYESFRNQTIRHGARFSRENVSKEFLRVIEELRPHASR